MQVCIKHYNCPKRAGIIRELAFSVNIYIAKTRDQHGTKEARKLKEAAQKESEDIAASLEDVM